MDVPTQEQNRDRQGAAAKPGQNRDRGPSALWAGRGAVASTYLTTFVCYGAWLPGQPGAVDRNHNAFGGPLPKPDADGLLPAGRRMKQAPYCLDAARRRVVLASFQQVCSERAWTLLAAHVRTRHVHAVFQADRSPEQVMNALKAFASRALNRVGLDGAGRRRWARHSSTRYLWTGAAVSAAVHYVVCEQGEPNGGLRRSDRSLTLAVPCPLSHTRLVQNRDRQGAAVPITFSGARAKNW